MPGTDRDVFHVLTPDLMGELVDVVGDYELAVENNSVFAIAQGDISDRIGALKQLFGGLDVLVQHLGDLSDTWQASSSAGVEQSIAAVASFARAKSTGRFGSQLINVSVGAIFLTFGIVQLVSGGRFTGLGFLLAVFILPFVYRTLKKKS